ncbi:hypothetical protein ACHHY8_02495 [Enterobacter cloacae complex sp. 2024EL-00215]|uniref:hypothetical protein n=1 Tax=unclassified Enterobacter cloacae complex TaxID=2757714 RepID=UPI00374FE0AE
MSQQNVIKMDITDGTVDISKYLSPDNAGMLIDVAAVDSSGNQVSLSPGMVRIYVSPFLDVNAWFPFDSGAYAGLALRAKIVKSGIVASASQLIVSVFRDVYPHHSSPNGLFTGARSITQQSLVEAAIKNGTLFTASRRVTGVAAGAFLDSTFTTGSKPCILVRRDVGYTGIGVAAYVYRNATATGTPVPADINNPNDTNPATTTVTLNSGMTFTSGTLTVSVAYSEGNGSNQGQGNSQAKLGEPIIMLPNTTYVLRIQSLDTATQNINAYVSWIEGYPDFPI